MRAARHLWRRGLARLRLFDRLVSPRGDVLLALTDEFEAGDRALRVLLERDGRDTEDVPGFDGLADRQAELVGLICATPAQTLAGVVAKARCARLRPSEQGFDAALFLALSACDDLLRLDGARPPRTPPLLPVSGPSRDGDVGTSGKPERPQPADPDGTARLAVLRRGGLHRHPTDVLIEVVRSSFIRATPLPLGGFERGGGGRRHPSEGRWRRYVLRFPLAARRSPGVTRCAHTPPPVRHPTLVIALPLNLAPSLLAFNKGTKHERSP